MWLAGEQETIQGLVDCIKVFSFHLKRCWKLLSGFSKAGGAVTE